MKTEPWLWLAGLTALLAAQPALAQRSAREADQERGGEVPGWRVDEDFKRDVFTFVRVKYSVGLHGNEYGSGHTYRRWAIDFPDSDLNFSFRLQQVTSIRVNPDGKVLELTDKELFDYPFIYIVEPGRLTFTDEEIPILRRYLLNGGFLMCDDFWGDREWANFHKELKKVFPDREPRDLPPTHPIFHCVFDLKEKPQVPGFPWGIRSEFTGITYEQNHGPGCEEVHYRAILDDKERIMVMLCHNTDLGDGWEREGDNEYYFREFSESKAYPMGINIVFYAMTH
ncbi:MAG TPA: DUF4159 domain-containing protein [Candidatus Saccharimonadales bacterium]|jgi:hypothetical protein|nr:DUF4159 domain-containing protein [Candidatus Saccharimonadales bacterium]